MKYPDDFINKVISGDCLEVMKDIPDKSIDMILCDLPYGTTACRWDKIIPFEPLWTQYKRIIKDNGAIVLTASQPFTTDLINSNRSWFKYELIWEKNYSGGFILAKKRPMKYHENILLFYFKQPKYNPIKTKASESTVNRFKNNSKVNNEFAVERGDLNNIQQIKRMRHSIDINSIYPKSILKIRGEHTCNSNRQHPTQKPVALMEYLIKTYTNKGDLILDNCMGSGTTGVACKLLDRNFIGIEIEPKYVEIANNRIANTFIQEVLI